MEEPSRIRLYLRRFREARGMTQQEFATLIGCNRSYLTQLENGDTLPSLSMLCKFAQALGVQVRDLLDERPCPDCPYLDHLDHHGIRLSGTPIVSPALEQAIEHQKTLLYEPPRRTTWLGTIGVLLLSCLGL